MITHGFYCLSKAKDGSRAFVTGDFTDKGLTDDLDGLPPAQLLDLTEWTTMYEKDYVYVGKCGVFFIWQYIYQN